MHLTGTELLDCIALRRVRGGGVVLHGSAYLDQGRSMPCYLPDALCRLAEMELTELLSPDCSAGPRRVVLTPRGQVRHQELIAKRDSYSDPEQPSGGCSVPLLPLRLDSLTTSLGRRSALNDQAVTGKTTQQRDEK